MDKLRISMLGEFSLRYNDVKITEECRRSKKMWMLLQYIITFHEREISQNELIDLLWPESASENPAGALKAQIHRLRNTLNELNLPEDSSIILNFINTYAFNTKLDYEIDFEVFEGFCKRAASKNISKDEQLEMYLQAIEIYKGDFLHKISDEQWVVPLTTYYHGVFVSVVNKAIELLNEKGMKNEVITLCRKALSIDAFDERIHYSLIKTLAEIGDKRAAKEHYEYVINLFYNQQGVNPSRELVNLYETTIRGENEYEIDIDVIIDELNSESFHSGAFFCEFEFLKLVYHISVNNEKRNPNAYDKEMHLCLITMTDENDEMPDKKYLSKYMDKLKECISNSLRSNDMFARYSVSQYIIFLLNADDNISEKIIARVIKKFSQQHPSIKVKLTGSFANLT